MSTQDGSSGALELRKAEVGGVPVLWAEGPEPAVGALVFRVGRADETLARAGLTHLVEHLAFFSLGALRFAHNGVVEDTFTTFAASGTREEVCRFLSEIGRSLGSLPVDRLETERRVLLTESQSSADDPVGPALLARFGATGYGLAGCNELGLYGATPEQVSAWARERFTAGNAALWLTFEPGDDLSVTLPPGDPIPPPPPEPIPGLILPAHMESGNGLVVHTMLVSRSTAAVAAAAVAGERIRAALRTDAGLSYNIASFYRPLTTEVAHVSLLADCLDEHAFDVRAGMVSELTGLAQDGPTEAELADHLEDARRQYLDPRSLTGFLDSCVADLLLGGPVRSPAEVLERVAANGPGDVASALDEGLRTGLVLSPEHTRPPAAGFARYEIANRPSKPVAADTFKTKRLRSLGGGVEVALADDRIALTHPSAGTLAFRHDEVVAFLSLGAGAYAIAGSTGETLGIDRGSFADGAELVRRLHSLYGDRLVVLDELTRRGEVEKVASAKLKRRWTVEEELAFVREILAPAESLVTMAETSRRLHTGLVVVTDRRVLTVTQAFRERSRTFVELRLDRIESVRAGKRLPGVRGASITILSDGASHRFSNIVPPERAAELADEIRRRAGSSTASAPGR